jgi:hypothetical protein
MLLQLCLLLALLQASSGYRLHLNQNQQRRFNRLAPLSSFEQGSDGTFSDTSDVKQVLSKIMETIKPLAGSGIGKGDTDDLTILDVESKFKQILSDIKASSTLTEGEKRMLVAESSLTLQDAKERDDNAGLYTAGVGKRIPSTEATYKTSIYDQSVSPVVLACGPGPVGQALLELGKSLGKSAVFHFLDADQLTVMQEKELNYAVRDARSVIIAGDSKNKDKPFVIDDKSVKRLLNAVMNERNKSPTPYSVKIVALAQATKQPKGLASIFGGDTTDLDDEVILQCQKRQLAYAIVKVGSIVSDGGKLPANAKPRSAKALAPKLPARDEEIAAPIPEVPVVFTRSRVESSECTRLSIAVGALLRASTHPQTNSTISVLSSDNLERDPTDREWDDEFLRIVGPELERIPLRFASEMQVVLTVGRIAKQLVDPKSGLITPIEVERFANGVRILFRPKESNYMSFKDEKRLLAESETNAVQKPTKSGYISPEQEALMEMKSAGTTPPKSERKAPPPEGGLEVIVDTVPYRRVRIRRCNYGKETIVKEESEALILRSLTRGIAGLEKMYRDAMLSSS